VGGGAGAGGCRPGSGGPPVELTLAAREKGLPFTPAERLEGRRPLLRREHLHPFAVGLPVPGALLVDPCDQLVAHDEERDDRLWVGAQRVREEILLEDLDQRVALSDPLEGPDVHVAKGDLETRERFHRKVFGERRMTVDEESWVQSADESDGLEEPLR